MSIQVRIFAAVGGLFLLLCLSCLAGLFGAGTMVQAGILGLGVLFAVFALIQIRARLTAPLEAIRHYALAVARGEKTALTGRFLREMDDLRTALTGMVAHLEDASRTCRESEAEALRQHRSAEEALAKSRAEEAEVSTLLANMNTAAAKAQAVSEKIFAAIGELTGRVNSVSQGVEVQRDRMTETATAMEEMTGTIIEVARNAASAAKSAEHSKQNAATGAAGVRRAVASIERVRDRILTLKETMAQLGQQAEGIGRVITVINEIADQTNLLALNAAIEAARAGDAGRGFAVVADEVRKLAEKTMAATKEVGDAVERIQARAQENVTAVEQAAGDIVDSAREATDSGRFMEEIVGIVDDTALQVASIATASEEQSAAGEEINRAVSEVTRVAQETAQGMEQSSHALVEVSSLVEELDMIIQGLASGKLDNLNSDRLVEWTPALSVGIGTIDDQHKVLVDLINELHQAMRQRRSDKLMLDVVDRLKNYTVKHFQQEERFFAQHGYPEAKSHAEIHRKFEAKVMEFEAALKKGTAKVTMDIMRFLKEWLVGHIQGTDKKYAPFLQAKGVK